MNEKIILGIDPGTTIMGFGLIKVKDKKNKASNDFAITIGSGASAFFEFYFKVENLKLLPGDYKVQVSSKGISYFTHKNLDVSYFIALEPESTYNA